MDRPVLYEDLDYTEIKSRKCCSKSSLFKFLYIIFYKK